MDILTTEIPERLIGHSLMLVGEDVVYGEHCWLINLGDNNSDSFFAWAHFAVTDSGEIYEMAVSTGEYFVLEQK